MESKKKKGDLSPHFYKNQETTKKLLYPSNLAFLAFFNSLNVCVVTNDKNDINNCHHDRIPKAPS